MNYLVHQHTEPEGFISMFYVIVDATTGDITYSTAGHEPALLFCARTGGIRQLRTPGTLLGIKEDATFAEAHTSIEIGDALLLYTDGLVEAFADGDQEAFTILGTMLADLALNHPQEIANDMYERATHARSGRPPDDIAVMAVRRTTKVTHDV